jgi:hypothetical protein
MEIGFLEPGAGLDNEEANSYEELLRKEDDQKQRNIKSFRPIIYEMAVPKEVAEAQQKLENLGESKFHKEKALDIANNIKDAEREKRAEQTLRDEEDDLEKLLEKYRSLIEKQEDGPDSLKPKETLFLKQTDEQNLKKWLIETRSQRQTVSKNRVTLNTIRRGMEQDLKLLRKTSTGNSWRFNEQTGRMVATYKSAPKYVVQNLKRSKEDIGRDIAKMFCKSESLKKLNMTDVTKLLTEYKDVWEPEDSMWNTIAKALENIDANKADISRVGIVQSCWAILSVENQSLAEKAMDVIFNNTTTTYEFKLPAKTAERTEKVKQDGKGEAFLKKKQQIRDHTVNTKFRNMFKEHKKPAGGNKKGYQGNQGYQGNRGNPKKDAPKGDKGDKNAKKRSGEKTPGYKGKRENFIQNYDPTKAKKSKPSYTKKEK